jgi:biopolymer transport protein ExbB/TolQ/biopolymer transport protein ExbD
MPGPLSGAVLARPGGWHHLAVVANNGQVTLSLDGSPYASVAASLPALNTAALIGGDTSAPSPAPAAAPAQPADGGTAAPGSDATAAPGPDAAAAAASVPSMAGFIGDIDELQIAKVATPAGFIKFAAIGQGPDQAKLISFSVDEETASWLSGYFAVILKSVTLDGWVVIGLLVVMAALSWVVMVDRATYLNRQAKANAVFMKSFREVADDLTVLDSGQDAEVASLGGRLAPADAKVLKSSSLYRIYHIGAEEIRHRFARNGGRAVILSGASIAAIRAALDSGVVKELQRLNRLMVILTIAISGGPFLGLLGTVVGVMITFAAIAASGDVNVNAIAPGIAAALVATVAGLGVAIPALFGYNYLISKIKNLSSDIQVFVDELDGGVLFLGSSRSDRTSHCRGVTAMQIQDDSKPYDDINITPMLDLAYVLLVIFIIMTTATVQGQKVNLPKASAAPSLATQTTKAITVANDGKIFLDTIPVTLPELEQRLVQQKALTPDFPVVLRGDAQAQYQSVMDVLDLLGRIGLNQVGLATKPLVK